MSRYRSYGPRDDPTAQEADEGFSGFRSRVQPAALPPGVASYIENGRCDRGTFRPRLGNKAAATDLTLANPPVVLDFVLPVEKSVTSLTRVGTTATATVTAHGYSTADVIGIHGATGADKLFWTGDFTITVTGVNTFTYVMTGVPAASPATGTIVCAKGLRLFETYDDLLRGSGDWASTGNVEGVVLATTDKAFLYRYGLSSSQLAYPAGETVQATDKCALIQFLNQVYLFRGYQTADQLTVSSLTRAGAVATVTTSAAHGRATNDWVTIIGATGAEYNGIFQITVTGATTFTYAVTGAPTSPDPSTGITARPCKPALVWDGNPAHAFTVVPTGYNPSGGTLIRLPAVDWAEEMTRRLVLPYSRDEVILSGFGTAADLDKQYGELRIRPGTADWLVAGLPYQALRLLVLYRKSVHAILLDSGSAAPVDQEEITRDFGCVARRSVANCGAAILWLADQGVHGLQLTSTLDLVPLDLPLSDQIDDIIKTINWAYAGDAVAKYWNNRYYLAVPTGTSTRNNTLLVFNFLNRSASSPLGEWESVDTFRGDFDVKNFHVLDFAGQKSLHVATSYGWIFVLDQLEAGDEWGNPSSPVATMPVVAQMILRDFRLGTADRKKFTRVRLTSNLTVGDAFTVEFVGRNPDSRVTIANVVAATSSDEEAALRVPRVRAATGTLDITTSVGRPEIRSVVLEASVADRADNTRS